MAIAGVFGQRLTAETEVALVILEKYLIGGLVEECFEVAIEFGNFPFRSFTPFDATQQDPEQQGKQQGGRYCDGQHEALMSVHRGHLFIDTGPNDDADAVSGHSDVANDTLGAINTRRDMEVAFERMIGA